MGSELGQFEFSMVIKQCQQKFWKTSTGHGEGHCQSRLASRHRGEDFLGCLVVGINDQVKRSCVANIDAVIMQVALPSTFDLSFQADNRLLH